VVMCITTFVTQKQIMRRSGPVEGQAAMVQKVLLYGMPLSLFVTGFFFPIGVLLYWTTNNLWTLGQQFFILRKLPPVGSDAHKAKLAADKPVIDPKTLAPKPGAKPVRTKGGRPVPPASPAPGSDDGADGAASTGSSASGAGSANGSGPAAGGGAGNGSGKASPGGRAPGGKGGSGPANRGKRKRR
jgi:YidC/Oxa1 family membrane protein insertase